MIATIYFSALLQTPGDARLAQIARERKLFDLGVVHTKAHEMEENIYSMGPGSQHIYGFYPLGKSDRRFLVATYDGGHARTLLYQAIRRGKPRTIWTLNLRDTKKQARVKGTLAAMLRVTYHVEVAGKVTREERRSLSSSQLQAGFGYDGISRPYGWIVQANGREQPYYSLWLDSRGKYFPILAEESEALGLGNRTWPPDLRPGVWPPGTGDPSRGSLVPFYQVPLSRAFFRPWQKSILPLGSLGLVNPALAPEGHGVYKVKSGDHNSTFRSGKGTSASHHSRGRTRHVMD